MEYDGSPGRAGRTTGRHCGGHEAKRTELKIYRCIFRVNGTISTQSALAAYGKNARCAVGQTDKLGDKDTADIVTEISLGVDKYLWFVEAHIGQPSAARRRKEW